MDLLWLKSPWIIGGRYRWNLAQTRDIWVSFRESQRIWEFDRSPEPCITQTSYEKSDLTTWERTFWSLTKVVWSFSETWFKDSSQALNTSTDWHFWWFSMIFRHYRRHRRYHVWRINRLSYGKQTSSIDWRRYRYSSTAHRSWFVNLSQVKVSNMLSTYESQMSGDRA